MASDTTHGMWEATGFISPTNQMTRAFSFTEPRRTTTLLLTPLLVAHYVGLMMIIQELLEKQAIVHVWDYPRGLPKVHGVLFPYFLVTKWDKNFHLMLKLKKV